MALLGIKARPRLQVDSSSFKVEKVDMRRQKRNTPSQCKESVCPASPAILLDRMKHEIKLFSWLWPQLEAIAGENFQVLQPRLSVSKIFQQ
jgi:hypothetical protein